MQTEITIVHYELHEVASYINWIYFFHAWGFSPMYAAVATIHQCEACRTSWLSSFSETDRPKAVEAVQLYKEAIQLINQLDGVYHVHATYKLMEAFADGDDLLLDGQRLPLLRQQTVQQPNQPFLCLSDFIRPLTYGIPDTVGVFATTVDKELEQLYADDAYQHMLIRTLSERFAEAAAEKLLYQSGSVHADGGNGQICMGDIWQQAYACCHISPMHIWPFPPSAWTLPD